MNWRRSAIGLGVAVPIIGLLVYGLEQDPNEIISALPGRPAPDFSLATLDGADTLRLSDYRGQVVVVNFWAAWCLECDVEHETLIWFSRTYAERGVRFVGVLFNDTPRNGTRWLDERGGEVYPAVWDEKLRTSISYGLRGVPETYVVAPDGTVAAYWIGAIVGSRIAEFRNTLDYLTDPASDMGVTHPASAASVSGS